MVVKGNDVYCKAGCTETNGPMNEFINEKELMPNMTYHIDGHFNYQTDELGRVSSSYEKLSGVDELERSGKRCSLQGIVTSKDGLPDDVGGHIVANNVHGPTEAINIFPQNCDLNNSGEWKQMENYIQSAVQEGKDVVVSKESHYNGDSKRPSDIDVCIQTNGIRSEEHTSDLQ